MFRRPRHRLRNGWVQLIVVADASGVAGHVVRPERLALANARVDLLGGRCEINTPRRAARARRAAGDGVSAFRFRRRRADAREPNSPA
jgi:hypothetical protein